MRWRGQLKEWTAIEQLNNLVEPNERSLEQYRRNGETLAWRKKAEVRLNKVFDEVRALVPFKLEDSQIGGRYQDTLAKTRKTVKVELTLPQIQSLIRHGERRAVKR